MLVRLGKNELLVLVLDRQHVHNIEEIIPVFVEQIPETFINRARAAYRYCDLDVSKETFAEIFRRLSIYGGAMARSSVDFALNYDIGYKKMQTVFAMEVFLELGFINFNRGILRFNNKVKSKLSSSRIYYEIEKLKN